jgi:molecular chaperone GrpE
LENKDKAVEIMKAAMEKEQSMNKNSNEAMDDQIDVQMNATAFDSNGVCKNVNADLDDFADIPTEEFSEELSSENQADYEEEEAQDGEEADTSNTKQAKYGKSFFKNSKSKDLAAKDQKIEELNDRLIRSMAEFDNFRKRSEKEKAQMFDIGAKSIVEKLLPIVDNFERGLGAITDKERESAFAQGIELIHKQLLTSLDEIGVKPIDAVGKEFDPNLHNAVMHGEDESLGENIVSDEFQKGYMYREYVIRHSMVKVVN